MKMRNAIVGLTLIGPLSIAWAVGPNPDNLPKVACSEFKFSAAFLERYPKAPAACLEGRVYKGVRYAKFTAKVFLASPDVMTVQLLNVAGDPITTFSFKPSPGAGVTINGKKEKFADMKPGEVLTFWVPEGHMEVHAVPTATSQAWQVVPPPKGQ